MHRRHDGLLWRVLLQRQPVRRQEGGRLISLPRRVRVRRRRRVQERDEPQRLAQDSVARRHASCLYWGRGLQNELEESRAGHACHCWHAGCCCDCGCWHQIPRCDGGRLVLLVLPLGTERTMHLTQCAAQCTAAPEMGQGMQAGHAGTQAATGVGAVCGTGSDQRQHATSQHRSLGGSLLLLGFEQSGYQLLTLLLVVLHTRSAVRRSAVVPSVETACCCG